MDSADCSDFLQWALPRLELRWPGFRKVRRQVCRRLERRIEELQLADLRAYRARLEADPREWQAFDECCHITISRFFRDRHTFEYLRTRILPEIAGRAKEEGRGAHIWSAGSASGEEPYTLKIIWDLEVARSYAGVPLQIVATDVDATMLKRAQEGCFTAGSLRELPANLVAEAFDRAGSLFCVKPEHRAGIEFVRQDLRTEMPALTFDLVLCRYVAFTYFAAPLQERVLRGILSRLLPGGYLVIGAHERLPANDVLVALAGTPQIFRKKM